MKKSALILEAASWLLIFAMAGCGYTTRSAISSKYKTVYITPFINKIDITNENNVENKYKVYRPGLETDVSRRVNNKFLFDGNLKPSTKEFSDLVLKGELVEFSRDPLRYSDNDDVQEYRVNVRVNISLWDNKENRMIWEENGFTGFANYYTSFYPVAAERKDESVAVNEAIDDLARRIVERAVEVW